MGIEDYFKTLLAALIGKAQMRSQPQGAQALSQAMGGSPVQQQPPQGALALPQGMSSSPVQQQTLTGGPTFAPDAQGNLQIVDDPNQSLPAGVLGVNAYMNQQNLPPLPPSLAAMQNPQFVNLLTKLVGGVYGGGNP